MGYFGLKKIAQFYGLRIIISVTSGLVECAFVHAIEKAYNKSVAKYLKIMLIFSPGMFIAAPAFLPSSWAMVFVTWASLAWFKQDSAYQIFQVVGGLGVGSLLGWPFAAALGLPFLVKCIFNSKFLQIFMAAIFSLVIIMVYYFC